MGTEGKIRPEQNQLAFKDMSAFELAKKTGGELITREAGKKVIPLLLHRLPHDDAHISFRSPVSPNAKYKNSDYEKNGVSFLRKYGTDPEGRVKNKDYILNKSIVVFEEGSTHFVLDHEENSLTSPAWITISGEGTSITVAETPTDVPPFIRSAIESRNK